jgi:O-antigen/teichoic acid export membrane protein
MSVFNLGLGDANIRYISSFKATGREGQIGSIITFTLCLGLVVLAIGGSSGYVLARMIDSGSLFQIGPELKTLASRSTQLALWLFGLKFMEVIVLSIYQGFERYDKAASWSLASRMAILSMSLLIVKSDKGLVEVFSASCAVQALMVLLQWTYVRRLSRHVTIKFDSPKKIFKEVFSFSFWTWLQSVFAIITTQADKFIVAIYSGVTSLTFYSLGSVVTTQVHSVFSSLSGWVFPVVSRKSSMDQSISAYFAKAEFALYTFGFACLSIALSFEDSLFTLWLGPDTYRQSAIFIRLFLYYNALLLVNILPFYFLNGAGHVRINTFTEFLMKVFNVVGMSVGYPLLGNEGLVWGLIVSMVPSTIFKQYMLHRYASGRVRLPHLIGTAACPLLFIGLFEACSPLFWAFNAISFLLIYYLLFIRRAFTPHSKS